jgi:hypothetical protein
MTLVPHIFSCLQIFKGVYSQPLHSTPLAFSHCPFSFPDIFLRPLCLSSLLYCGSRLAKSGIKKKTHLLCFYIYSYTKPPRQSCSQQYLNC